MLRYPSEYSNHVHMVNVSPSKHFWMRRDQTFAYQKKSIDQQIERHRKNPKKLFRRYLLVDHFSGLYFIQYDLEDAPLDLATFLFSAWSQKKNHSLWGVPEIVIIPRRHITESLTALLVDCGVELQLPVSGFHSGIRPLVDWNKREALIAYNRYSFQEGKWQFPTRWTGSGFEYRGRPPRGIKDLNQLAETLSGDSYLHKEHMRKWQSNLADKKPRPIDPAILSKLI